jgi:Protein of unknown function (DUF3047)
VKLLTTALLAITLAGCASPGHRHLQGESPQGQQHWHDVLLPGKEATKYAWTVKDGRAALSAKSERSASMWRRKLAVPAADLGQVQFSWWVDDLVAGANVREVDREDAPARVLFAFAGDVSKLPQRTRMMFDLAEALTGEAPPYATLMYVWESNAALESVIVNPRSDRIRKIVIDSGTAQLGRWRDHRRDLAADFRRAFGEDPGALVAVAVMTDSDNTRSTAAAWYGPVTLD